MIRPGPIAFLRSQMALVPRFSRARPIAIFGLTRLPRALHAKDRQGETLAAGYVGVGLDDWCLRGCIEEVIKVILRLGYSSHDTIACKIGLLLCRKKTKIKICVYRSLWPFLGCSIWWTLDTIICGHVYWVPRKSLFQPCRPALSLDISSLPAAESQALIHEIGNQSKRYSCQILYAFALATFWLRHNRRTSAIK